MEVLKIKAYQQFANYRVPNTYAVIDSYPLPPLLTVKGWFHSVIGAKEIVPVSMSIQGDSKSSVNNLQSMIKFKDIVKKKGVEEPNQVILEDFKKALIKTPTYVVNMVDTDLIIYLKADKDKLEFFKKKVFEKFTSIGRHEDLVRLDYVDFVNLDKKEFSMMENHELKYGIYMSKEKAIETNVVGTHYSFEFIYESINGVRYFNNKNRKNVVYTNVHDIDKGQFFYDSVDNRIVDLVGNYEFE